METGRTRLLIDAGLSCSECMKRLGSLGVDAGLLDGLLITHEHVDHIRGAGALARRLGIPVYINAGTLRKGMRSLGNLSRPVIVQTGQPLMVRDLLVETFTKCHDAADPMGVVISWQGLRLGVITDLGRSTSVVEARLKGCHALVMEFNHDERMLEEGPYPLELKRRIRGPDGHLSNAQAKELLMALAHEDLSLVVPAHLSETNNSPEEVLKVCRAGLASSRTKVTLGTQGAPTSMLDWG